MKKLLFALIIMLTACNSSNIEEIEENNSLPNKIVKATKDTTLVFDKCIVSSGEYNYVLQKTSKEVIAIEKINKENNDASIFWLGFLICLLIILIIYSNFE